MGKHQEPTGTYRASVLCLVTGTDSKFQPETRGPLELISAPVSSIVQPDGVDETSSDRFCSLDTGAVISSTGPYVSDERFALVPV